MHGLVVDLRHSLRALRRDAGVSAIAVLALAIGVGGSTSMFTIVDAVLVRPLPYTAPERLLLISPVDGAGQRVPMGPAEFIYLAKNATTLEAIGVFYPHSATIAAGSGAKQTSVADLSSSMFTTLGVAPARGRAFEPAEDFAGREPVAVVSDAFWRRELGGDLGVVGRTIEVDHKAVTVIGVLPLNVVFPRLGRFDVFLPLAITPAQAAMRDARTGLYGIVRMKRGIAAAAVRAEMDTLMRAFNGYGIVVQPLSGWLTDDAAPAIRVAFAAALLLLLIACANVALLLMMRGTARGRDLAIRAALGGGRGRLALQQISEGLLLAFAGGALGLILAALLVRGVVALAPGSFPRLNELRLDLAAAAFALIASLLSGVLAGAASAWQALRPDLFLVLKDGGASATAGSTRSRVRDGLVVAQFAIALLLATGTGLLVRSLDRFSAVPVGLEPRGLLATLVYFRGDAPVDATAQLLSISRTVPGVEEAALVGLLPFDWGRGWDDTITVRGRQRTATTWDVTSVNWFSPGYLALAGTRVLKGRDFTATDGASSAPVALVNQTFVDKFLAAREPIGELVGLSDWTPISFTVVGVVQDVRQNGPGEAPVPEIYLPEAQFARNKTDYADGAMLVVRSSLPAGRVEAALRAAATGIESQLLVGTTKPVDEYLGGYFRTRRFQLDLAAAFAAAALALAALGVYGAMAFSVVQRRRELAVRAALGAQASQLFGLVIGRGARLALLGICLGVLGSLVLSRFLAALLYGVGPRDPLTLVAAVATLGSVAIAASLLPALAAAKLDPMIVLRDE
ncbi:MAG TPA: ADOP family duplicated permease [Myxococcales bacterium]|jgi:predicted permease